MGFFSRLFQSKPKRTYEDQVLGTFTLVYSQGKHHLWSNDAHEVSYSVRGSEELPNTEAISFLHRHQEKIDELEREIVQVFKPEFLEAGMDFDMTSWKNRFNLVNVDVFAISEEECSWNLTFQDTHSPFFQYTIHLEGDTVQDGLTIDT